jgi:hypothetical protein
VTGDEQAAAMIPVACELICAVRDGNQPAIAKCPDSLIEWDEQGFPIVQKLYDAAVVLAAMVPDDAPLPELLGWLEDGSPQREEMLRKAHGRAAKRQGRGLPLWGPLAGLEAQYQAGVVARRRARGEATRAA